MNEIVARINELERRIEVLENKLNTPTERSQDSAKQKSVREFLNEKSPGTVTDRALCIGYYFEILKQSSSFNADDVRSGFREAKIPAPKNPNDIINKNIAKGLIMESGELKDGKKSWVLTATGEELVAKGFGKEK